MFGFIEEEVSKIEQLDNIQSYPIKPPRILILLKQSIVWNFELRLTYMFQQLELKIFWCPHSVHNRPKKIQQDQTETNSETIECF